MTHLAVGFGRGFPRAWLVPIFAMTFVLGLAVSGVLSRSIVADLVAWWPVWVGLGVAAYVLRNRQFGPVRAAGLVPIVGLLFVILFAWGHLSGWAVMPSASQSLVGPEVGAVARAALQASIDGEVDVAAGEGALYRVDPIRRGGAIGVPTATEHISGTAIDVALEPPAEPGLYSYSGWDMSLSPSPAWSLDLDGAVEADLSGLDVVDLSLGGAGQVDLATPSGPAAVRVSGSYRISIPAGTPANVVGIASVPASWLPTDSGAHTPVEGDGWTITVVGEATVSVVER